MSVVWGPKLGICCQGSRRAEPAASAGCSSAPSVAELRCALYGDLCFCLLISRKWNNYKHVQQNWQDAPPWIKLYQNGYPLRQPKLRYECETFGVMYPYPKPRNHSSNVGFPSQRKTMALLSGKLAMLTDAVAATASWSCGGIGLAPNVQSENHTRVYCLARKPWLQSKWHATLQHVHQLSLGVSHCPSREPTARANCCPFLVSRCLSRPPPCAMQISRTDESNDPRSPSKSPAKMSHEWKLQLKHAKYNIYIYIFMFTHLNIPRLYMELRSLYTYNYYLYIFLLMIYNNNFNVNIFFIYIHYFKYHKHDMFLYKYIYIRDNISYIQYQLRTSFLVVPDFPPSLCFFDPGLNESQESLASVMGRGWGENFRNLTWQCNIHRNPQTSLGKQSWNSKFVEWELTQHDGKQSWCFHCHGQLPVRKKTWLTSKLISRNQTEHRPVIWARDVTYVQASWIDW